jgi:uncharacterized membrane protein YiaA
MIGYLLISVLYCATFIAWMKTKEKDEYESVDYMDRYGDWHIKYILLCILGTLLWPLVIPFIIFYKLAFKILNKTNKTK